MTNFKVGQVVQCISNTGAPELMVESYYTVRAVRPATGGVKLREVEVAEPTCSGYFRKDRFKPIDPIDDEWLDEIFSEDLELEEVLEEIGTGDEVGSNG